MSLTLSESNHSGVGLEYYIEHEFKSRNVLVQYYSVNANNHDLFVEGILLKCVPYTNIYGCRSTSEFVYSHGPVAVRIECRRQDVSGSVDEKFPYLLMNAIEAMPENNIWFVVDGNGARKKALEWLHRKARSYGSKNIRLYNLTEARIAIKNLLTKGEL